MDNIIFEKIWKSNLFELKITANSKYLTAIKAAMLKMFY